MSSRLNSYPSILFGLETAFRSLESSDSVTLFSSEFTKNQDSIPINGLIWMGQKKFMISQIKEKINSNLEKNKIDYLDKPYTRFEGKEEQQETFFIKDPHGNILELKTLKNSH